MTQGLKRSGENGRTEFYPLELLPTPNAVEGEKWTTKYNPDSQMGKGLTAMALNNLLPTPMSTDIHHAGRVKDLKEQGKTKFRSREKGQSGANGLTDFLDFNGLLLTPGAADGMRANFTMESLRNHNKPHAERSNLSEQIAHKIGGGTSQLNPLFVAEMMNFPPDWLVSPFLGGGRNP